MSVVMDAEFSTVQWYYESRIYSQAMRQVVVRLIEEEAGVYVGLSQQEEGESVSLMVTQERVSLFTKTNRFVYWATLIC